MWNIIADSDGHRWLVSPTGQWIAAFIMEVHNDQIEAMLGILNQRFIEEVDRTTEYLMAQERAFLSGQTS